MFEDYVSVKIDLDDVLVSVVYCIFMRRYMKSAYQRTENLDLSRFRRDLVGGFFGELEAEYWHGMDCTTDEVIHLTKSTEWCVIRKLKNGCLPSRPKDPLLREWE